MIKHLYDFATAQARPVTVPADLAPFAAQALQLAHAALAT
ncbi:hypothetical protein AC519_3603 [Pseudomonas savastanoi]|nr:hypothetical protein AC519_3603 [Pseudomonas savastanoi]